MQVTEFEEPAQTNQGLMQIEENSGNNTSILGSGNVTSGGKRQAGAHGNYNLNSFNSTVNPNTTASRFYNP